MSARLGPEWQALVEAQRALAGCLLDQSLGYELEDGRMETTAREAYDAADRLLAADGREAPAAAPTGLPMQPLFLTVDGLVRFRANALVRYLLDHGGLDLNALACVGCSDEERQQFAQLIGYSLGGYSELSYVSDESYERAERAAAALQERSDPDAPASPAPAEPDPDDELETLLRDYGHMATTHRSVKLHDECVDCRDCRQRIHAEVQRREAAAREAGLREAIKTFSNEYDEALASGCDSDGARDCALNAVDALTRSAP